MLDSVVLDIGWLVIAFGAGLGARALRLPPLVGYLLAGMGLALLGVEDSATLNRLGTLGVALLLFIVGLDLRWQNLARPEVVGAGAVHLALFSGLAFLGGWAWSGNAAGTAAVAVALGSSSLVMAAKALEVQRSLRAYHGRVAIGISLLHALVATTALVPLGPTPSLWALAIPAIAGARPVLRRLLDVIEPEELILFFGLALATAGYLLFEAVGVSGELGALVVGALLAGHERTTAMADALNPIKDTFLAAFFLSVGLVGLPTWNGVALVGLLTGLIAVKSALFFGVLVGFRLRARTAFLAALPLTSYSGFTLIMGSAAVEAGLLAEATLTALAVALVVSYLINAGLGRHTTRLWRGVRPVMGAWERAVEHPDAQPQTLGHAQYLVVGMERIGTAAYDYLTARLKCTAGMDDDPRRIAHHRGEGRRVLYADARSRSLWEEMDFGRLETVILTLTSQAAKLDVIRALRAAGFEGSISALTADPSDRQALMDAGANAVYISIDQAGQALAAYSLQRGADPIPGGVTLDVATQQNEVETGIVAPPE
mgnify:CR=1 FL=1